MDGPANRPPVLSGPNRASALAWRIADVQRGEVTTTAIGDHLELGDHRHCEQLTHEPGIGADLGVWC